MFEVADLLSIYPTLRPTGYPQQNPKTAVYLTGHAQKDLEKNATPKRLAQFAQAAWKGLKNARLRAEGSDDLGGILAYGKVGDTERYCGYFQEVGNQEVFILCGVWKGKRGSGNARPPYGDTVAARTFEVRKCGVVGVVQETVDDRSAEQAAEQRTSHLLRAWTQRRSGESH